MARSFICVAVALMLGVAAAAAQEPIVTRGAWRLVADGEDFALRTEALGAPENTLSLFCRKAQQRHALELKSPALAARPEGEELRVGFKVDDGELVWLTLATGPGGTVPIAHQTAFWIIYEALRRNGASTVGFTAAERAWVFDLGGLRDLTESLNERCGFEPSRPEPPPRSPPGPRR
ncbi:MAG: hypothetical protein E6G97_25380 [Alphaproteobacteria bacterium]|nr:MAG: hypothetical protein E6G97_25380 [Alphaproteobacteria bacterium]